MASRTNVSQNFVNFLTAHGIKNNLSQLDFNGSMAGGEEQSSMMEDHRNDSCYIDYELPARDYKTTAMLHRIK